MPDTTRPARVTLAGLVTGAVLLGLWETLVRSGVLVYTYLPPPSQIGGGAARVLASGELVDSTLHTVWSTLLGWSAASLAGVGLGLVLGLSQTSWRYTMASIETARSAPPITMVPVALLVFGFSVRTELVVIVYAATWPVLINTIGGVRGVPGALLDVAKTLGLSRTQTVRRIILPAALPLTVVGLRLALSFALILAVVTEMVGNPSGLGHSLVRAQQALRPDEMFAYVVTIGLVGVALNAALGALAARTLPSLAGGRQSPGP